MNLAMLCVCGGVGEREIEKLAKKINLGINKAEKIN
jgi:bacterioferritin-associated ferredoxin